MKTTLTWILVSFSPDRRWMTKIKKSTALIVLYFSLFVGVGPDVFAQGATTPFKTLEAEGGVLGGGATVRSLTTMPSGPTLELESSGRALVELNAAGESVTLNNTTGISSNTIVIRASIPDAPTGGGINATLNLYVNGVFRQALNLTSKYSWVYGDPSQWTDNNPADGTPHRFYEETRAFITGAPIAPGSTIMLKKDSGNTAAFYDIDLIDLENVGPAKTQPANTLSIVDYGATPDDTTDDTNAFKACIAACQAQGKQMWIPAGNFITGTRIIINPPGIVINGAGMWYTTMTRLLPAPSKWDFYNCTVRDLYIDNPEVARNLAGGHDCGLQMSGSGGWLIERVWVHRGGVGFWLSGSNGTIRDCRSGDSWADGINLNNGPNVDPQKAGLNLTAQNNFLRGSEDDGIAINAQNGGGTAGNILNAKVLNNTTVATIFANGLRIAGGRNSTVQDNLILDPADLNGIYVGIFGALGNPCESALVKNNTIVRGGGYGVRTFGGGIYVSNQAVATFQGNMVVDALLRGISLNNCNVTVVSNIVIHPALTAFQIIPGSSGTATINYNTATGLNSGQVAYRNDAAATFTASLTGNSWQQTNTEASFYADTNYGGAASQVLAIGTYTQAQLLAKGVSNKSASSVRVPSGRQVIMYSADNFTGTSWTATYDTPDFTRLSPSANDQMSSCEVQSAPAQLAAMSGNTTANTLQDQTNPAPVIQVHQGLSPNGDGLNDVLKIDNITSYPENLITIVDRNGTQVFTCKNYDNSSHAFNGHASNGAILPAGSYFYLLEYEDHAEKKRSSGYIILKY
jgi:gliding motility-associated-like protein